MLFTSKLKCLKMYAHIYIVMFLYVRVYGVHCIAIQIVDFETKRKTNHFSYVFQLNEKGKVNTFICARRLKKQKAMKFFFCMKKKIVKS